RARNRLDDLSSMPIGVADSFGHPVLIADFEARLAKWHTPELQYVTAVSNQLGVRIDIAKNLYSGLSDPRAKRALAALDAGRPEVIMPTAGEMFRAYTAGASFFAGFPHALTGLFIIGILFLTPFLFIKPA